VKSPRLWALELGLTVKTHAKPTGKAGRRSRAAELAAKQIERMIDPSAPSEERDRRERRLTKGPPEFREDRVDLPKAKGKAGPGPISPAIGKISLARSFG
jgi:hypothetical protein